MVLQKVSPGLLVILRVYARRMFGKELYDLTREEYELLVEKLFPRQKNILMEYYDRGIRRRRLSSSRHFQVRGPSLFGDDALPA